LFLIVVVNFTKVLFTGEKIGIGMAKTKKDAHQQAAENALRSLAGKVSSRGINNCGSISPLD